MADYKLVNGRVSRTPPANARNRGASRHSIGRQDRSQKPTQGIPIHVDGNRDELSNVDPDLTLAELELKLLAESSDKSRGPVSGKHIAIIGDGGQTSVVTTMSTEVGGSRARPVKPHEVILSSELE